MKLTVDFVSSLKYFIKLSLISGGLYRGEAMAGLAMMSQSAEVLTYMKMDVNLKKLMLVVIRPVRVDGESVVRCRHTAYKVRQGSNPRPVFCIC